MLAVQIHAGGPMEVQFKDVMIQELPVPTAENPNAPGFHLRTVKTDQGERKYTVYVPQGYDGSKIFPVILFLHGAGESRAGRHHPRARRPRPGDLAPPGGLPAIVVFPQARETWAAGSADSKAALAALDDVMTAYATDPKRVVLTGLSMGGRGSWELAADASRKVRRRRADLRPRPDRRSPPDSRYCPSGASAATPTATRPSSTCEP